MIFDGGICEGPSSIPYGQYVDRALGNFRPICGQGLSTQTIKHTDCHSDLNTNTFVNNIYGCISKVKNMNDLVYKVG